MIFYHKLIQPPNEFLYSAHLYQFANFLYLSGLAKAHVVPCSRPEPQDVV